MLVHDARPDGDDESMDDNPDALKTAYFTTLSLRPEDYEFIWTAHPYINRKTTKMKT
jgi:hypothetical protein